jgi:uncharacterized OB-fold protein
MRRMLACAIAVALLFAAGTPAWARDAKGKVKSWETTTRIVTLEDGSQYVVTETVTTTEMIKVGKSVKITYEEREGKNYVTTLDEIESP